MRALELVALLAEASLVAAPQQPVELGLADSVQVEALALAVRTPVVEGCSAINPAGPLAARLALLVALAQAAALGLVLRPGPGPPSAGQELLFSSPFLHAKELAAHPSTQW